MQIQARIAFLLPLAILVALAEHAGAVVISTFDPGGADAEVREAAPTTPRGTNDGSGFEHFELGMRENSTHNAHVYLKFGVENVTAFGLTNPITIRAHWMLNNLANNRIEDQNDQNNATFSDTPNVMFEYYVLDPNHGKANWNEALMIYGPGPQGAPALQFDGDFATDDLLIGPGNFTLLGLNELRSLNRNATQPIENRIPIGEAFDFTCAPGSPLHSAIVAAQATAHKTVTIVTTLQHDFDDVPIFPNLIGPAPSWNNHLYAFMSKEKPDVSVGPAPHYNQLDGYDNDTTDSIDWDPVTPGINPPHSPYQGQPNTQANPFAPKLILADPPHPFGDYNNDGTVDAADYVVWRKNEGTNNTLPHDPNGGTIDTDQYKTWRLHFGEQAGGAGGGTNPAVPEPTTPALISLAVAAVLLRPQVRRPRHQ